MCKAYDRYRNPLDAGYRVMQSDSRLVGTIAAIHAENLKREEIRRSKCVELQGIKEYFAPQELMCISRA